MNIHAVHAIGEFACQLCGRNFSNATSLRIHEQYSHAASAAPAAITTDSMSGGSQKPPPPSMHHGYVPDGAASWPPPAVLPTMTHVPADSRTPPASSQPRDDHHLQNDFWQPSTASEANTGHWIDTHFPPTPDSSGSGFAGGGTGSGPPSKSPGEEAAEILDLDSNCVQVYSIPPPPAPIVEAPPQRQPLPGFDTHHMSSLSMNPGDMRLTSHALNASNSHHTQLQIPISHAYHPHQLQHQRSHQQHQQFQLQQLAWHHQQQQQQQAAMSVSSAASPPQYVASVPSPMISGKHFADKTQLHQYTGNIAMQIGLQSREGYPSSTNVRGSETDTAGLPSPSTNMRRTKTYHCDVCDKRFTSMGHLKRHYNTIVHRQTKEGKRAAALGIVNPALSSSTKITDGGGGKERFGDGSLASIPPLISASSLIGSGENIGDADRAMTMSVRRTSPQFPITPPLQEAGAASVSSTVEVQQLSLHQQQLFERHQQQMHKQMQQQLQLQQQPAPLGSPALISNVDSTSYSHQQRHLVSAIDYQLTRSPASNEMLVQHSADIASGTAQLTDSDRVKLEQLSTEKTQVGFQPYSVAMCSAQAAGVTSVTPSIAYPKSYCGIAGIAHGGGRVETVLPFHQFNQPNLLPQPHATDNANFVHANVTATADNSHESCSNEQQKYDPSDQTFNSGINEDRLMSGSGDIQDYHSENNGPSLAVDSTVDHKMVVTSVPICCGRRFAGMAYYKQHVDSHHGGEDIVGERDQAATGHHRGIDTPCDDPERQTRRQHQCETCDKTFGHFSDLKRHRYTHLSEKPFMCSQCNRGFIRKDQLEKHMLTHDLRQSLPRSSSAETTDTAALDTPSRIVETSSASLWQPQQHLGFGATDHGLMSDHADSTRDMNRCVDANGVDFEQHGYHSLQSADMGHPIVESYEPAQRAS